MEYPVLIEAKAHIGEHRSNAPSRLPGGTMTEVESGVLESLLATSASSVASS